MSTDPETSWQSIKRVDAIVRDEGAQLWLHHDFVQTATIPHAPSFE